MDERISQHTKDWVDEQLSQFKTYEIDPSNPMPNMRQSGLDYTKDKEAPKAQGLIPDSIFNKLPNSQLDNEILDRAGKIKLKGREPSIQEKSLADASNVMTFLGVKPDAPIRELVEPPIAGFSEGLEQINRGIRGKGNLAERGSDIALGAGKSAISAIMSRATVLQPVANKLGESLGDNVAGDLVKEFAPFMTFKNPLALFGAAKGSEKMNKVANAIIESSDLSQENKERITDAVGLSTFILTHKLIGKGQERVNKVVGKWLDRKLDVNLLPENATRKYGQQESFIDNVVRRLQKPEYAQESVLGRKVNNFDIKPIETQSTYGLTNEILPLDLAKRGDPISKFNIVPRNTKPINKITYEGSDIFADAKRKIRQQRIEDAKQRNAKVPPIENKQVGITDEVKVRRTLRALKGIKQQFLKDYTVDANEFAKLYEYAPTKRTRDKVEQLYNNLVQERRNKVPVNKLTKGSPEVSLMAEDRIQGLFKPLENLPIEGLTSESFYKKTTESTVVPISKATEGGVVNNTKVKEGKIDPKVIENNVIESTKAEQVKSVREETTKKAPNEIEGNKSKKTARSNSENPITPTNGEGIRSGITYKEPKATEVAKEQMVQKEVVKEPISVEVQGQEFKGTSHLNAYKKAHEVLNKDMKFDEFMDKVVQKEVNDRIVERNNKKIEEIKAKNNRAKAFEEQNKVKQPYEMTRNEYIDYIQKQKIDNAKKIANKVKNDKEALQNANELVNRLNNKNYITENFVDKNSISGFSHKSIIAEALNRGEIVPREVLKDYPDLKSQNVTSNPTIERIKQEAQAEIKAENISFGMGLGFNEFKQMSPRQMAKTFKENTQVFQNVVKYAKSIINKGINTFKDFAKHLIDKFGQGIKPKLREIWSGAQKDTFKDRIAEYKTENQKPIENKGLNLEEEGLMAKLDRKLANRFSRIEKLADKGVGGKSLKEELTLYSSRAANAFDNVLNYINNPKQGFIKKLADAKISLDDLGEYLYAKHAKERNAKLLERTKVKDGSGISDKTADQILSKYKNTEIENLAKEFKKEVVDKNLDLLKENGFLTPEQYSALKQFEFYVPLKGKSGANQIQLGGKNLSVNSKGIYRARGRESIPNNPVIQSLLDFRDTIVRVEKNKVLQTFADFIEKNPSEMYSIKGGQSIPQYNVHGEITNFNKVPLKDNQIGFFKDGKQKVITINDPVLLQSFKGLGEGRSVRALSKINDYLRSVITLHNPEFLITNFQRDIQTALTNLAGEKSIKIAAKVALDTRKAIGGVWKSERGSKPNEWSKEFEEMQNLGGKTGWMNHKTLPELTADFTSELAHFNKKGKVKQALKSTLEFVDDLNLAVENGVRLSTFKNLKDAGYTPKEAAVAAKNITVNFNRKGEWGQAINTAYLFWNAGMQGSVRIYKALKHKNTRRFAYGLIALGAMENQLNRMIDEETYEKLAEWEKDAHWIFMTGDGGYLKIKKPYGYNVFPTLGNIISDVGRGKLKPQEGSTRMLKNLAEAFSPFGQSGSIAQLVSPTLADPVVQLIENKNFAGQPIYKDQPSYGMAKPNAQMSFKSINPYIQGGTIFLNKVFGANEKEAGLLDLNPEYVEHYLEFIGGGLGKFLSNTTQTGTAILQGKELPEAYKRPILRQFLGEAPDWVEMNTVYSMLREAGKTQYDEEEQEKFYDNLKSAKDKNKITLKQYRTILKQFRKSQSTKTKSTSTYKPTYLRYKR